MRLLWLFVGLAALVLIPFALWGEAFTAMFSPGGSVAWMRDYDAWAWAAGLLLLVADLFLPVPGTVVMSALGYLYGPVAGGLLAAGGSFCSGALAYGLCRGLGHGAARRLLGARDLARGEALFARVGGWIVVLSRWLPVFPEVVACMAGLTRMPAPPFFAALACGVLPLGFVFAAVGAAGVEAPGLAVGLSVGLPPVLWLGVRPLILRRVRSVA